MPGISPRGPRLRRGAAPRAPISDPTIERQRIILAGDNPSPIDPPPGCAFSTRCRCATQACRAAVPPLREVAPGHLSACIRDDLALQAPILAP